MLERGVKPSFILVDYTMPRINGLEFLKKVERDHPDLQHVPRFMISGYSREEVVNEAYALGCAFFEKTIDDKSFFQSICRDMAHQLGFA